eukprot:scaffold10192_cov59-Phaeocystis_antarctica.AAC.4
MLPTRGQGWLLGGGGSGGRLGPLGLSGHRVEVVSPAVRGLGLVPPCGQRCPTLCLSLPRSGRALCAPFYVIIRLSEGRRRGPTGRGVRSAGRQRGRRRARRGRAFPARVRVAGGLVGMAGSRLQAAADGAADR